jgi:hypothetical protein
MMQLDINFSEGFINDLSTLSNICQENNAESIDIVFKKYNKELKVKISFGLTEEGKDE